MLEIKVLQKSNTHQLLVKEVTELSTFKSKSYHQITKRGFSTLYQTLKDLMRRKDYLAEQNIISIIVKVKLSTIV